MPRSAFQHTSGQTQIPQRVHWWNFGLISSIACLKRRVPRRAAQTVLHVLAGLAGGPQLAAAEQAAEPLRELRAHAEGARVERRAVAIAALVAMELELVAGVVAVIGVVPGERDRAHGAEFTAKPSAVFRPLRCRGMSVASDGACVTRRTVLALVGLECRSRRATQADAPPLVGATEVVKLDRADRLHRRRDRATTTSGSRTWSPMARRRPSSTSSRSRPTQRGRRRSRGDHAAPDLRSS